ncbi:MAG: cytochrome c oxidase subunit 3 [Myxococcota bacterium]|nr:cytochrome c oxidase subunit 3 [Myxococcota bacterium]
MSGTPIATTRSAAGMPTGKLAVWWLIGSEIVIFGGVLASYIMHRLAHGGWSEEAAHTNTWIGALNTMVLLTSSLSAVLAHQAAEKGDGKKASKLLWATIVGAVTFMIVKAFEWTEEITHGYTIASSTFWSFYYTAAGIHASHVLAGAICMYYVAKSAAKGEHLHRVENVGLYWHFVDVVWIFLFPLLYIAK